MTLSDPALQFGRQWMVAGGVRLGPFLSSQDPFGLTLEQLWFKCARWKPNAHRLFSLWLIV